MKKTPSAILAAILLTAALPTLADAPLIIQEQELYQFWRPQGGPTTVQQARIKGSCERGQVQARYVIDADGFTRSVEIVSATGMNPFYERHVRTQVSRSRFTPAPDNDARQPVQLTETYRFECPPRI